MTQDEWNRQATNLLKAELARAGIGYEELIRRLDDLGVKESYKGIANKINRGAYSFTFFMQCMKALGKNEIRL
ncbi:DUF6471 domain-containing protein [Methylobacter sp.]|uniref:DUF6471 domain-containing protein n=1 Tax=Methylobacter sp. TaxID=2051955 RepID=UPI002489BB31|nr:DUF6471 domain-containing protein [Methylobacter sp.]MDI1278886.1 DUF6471 domain-containing protein [Methylobacter sp.]MDI1359684.1 DUF6471 domain-containing protein [Methylobacter sp.]